MRTDSVRFTVWLPFDDDSARPIWPDLEDMGALPACLISIHTRDVVDDIAARATVLETLTGW